MHTVSDLNRIYILDHGTPAASKEYWHNGIASDVHWIIKMGLLKWDYENGDGIIKMATTTVVTG